VKKGWGERVSERSERTSERSPENFSEKDEALGDLWITRLEQGDSFHGEDPDWHVRAYEPAHAQCL
jgi:hypothetical protein